MKGFSDALIAGFTLELPGPWVYRFGDRYQLCFEPMIGGGWFVALYHHAEGALYPELLLPDKVPVEAGRWERVRAVADSVLMWQTYTKPPAADDDVAARLWDDVSALQPGDLDLPGGGDGRNG